MPIKMYNVGWFSDVSSEAGGEGRRPPLVISRAAEATPAAVLTSNRIISVHRFPIAFPLHYTCHICVIQQED